MSPLFGLRAPVFKAKTGFHTSQNPRAARSLSMREARRAFLAEAHGCCAAQAYCKFARRRSKSPLSKNLIRDQT
jgi:hypothetical protein